MTEMSNDDVRNEVGKALEPIWWLRDLLDDDSPEAKALDEVRAFAQGYDWPRTDTGSVTANLATAACVVMALLFLAALVWPATFGLGA